MFFTFYLITVDLKLSLSFKIVGAKPYTIMQVVYNDNESTIEIFIKIKYLSVKHENHYNST